MNPQADPSPAPQVKGQALGTLAERPVKETHMAASRAALLDQALKARTEFQIWHPCIVWLTLLGRGLAISHVGLGLVRAHLGRLNQKLFPIICSHGPRHL